jgi:hypothetical protein
MAARPAPPVPRARGRGSGPSHRRGLCCPVGCWRYYGRLRRPLGSLPASRGHRLIGGVAPAASGRPPGRGGPPLFPPPPSERSTPSTPGSSSGLRSRCFTPCVAFALSHRARLSLAPAEAGNSDDAAGFASRCGPLSRSPGGLLTLGFDAGRFPGRRQPATGPPGSYRAGLAPAGAGELAERTGQQIQAAAQDGGRAGGGRGPPRGGQPAGGGGPSRPPRTSAHALRTLRAGGAGARRPRTPQLAAPGPPAGALRPALRGAPGELPGLRGGRRGAALGPDGLALHAGLRGHLRVALEVRLGEPEGTSGWRCARADVVTRAPCACRPAWARLLRYGRAHA